MGGAEWSLGMTSSQLLGMLFEDGRKSQGSTKTGTTDTCHCASNRTPVNCDLSLHSRGAAALILSVVTPWSPTLKPLKPQERGPLIFCCPHISREWPGLAGYVGSVTSVHPLPALSCGCQCFGRCLWFQNSLRPQ